MDITEDFYSDEPTRLANIITTMFSGQSGWSQSLSDDRRVELVVGADGQDDCAVFRVNGPVDIVVGSDYVRGSKFSLYELGYLDNFDIGYYLAMANFSDVAAMGALPVALLSVIRYPKDMSDSEFKQVMGGVDLACRTVGAPNVGGDIGSAERLILSASAVGVVESGRSLLRNGARPGDVLCITGPTGVAAAAQKYFGKLDVAGRSIPTDDEDSLISTWKRPQAKVRQGRILSVSGLVTSCQDSSDGLKAGIQTIARQSGVGFLVDEGALPVADLVRTIAGLSELPVTSMIMGDSVDFQLIFTVPQSSLDELRRSFHSNRLDFFEIGVATKSPDVHLQTATGSLTELPGAAWRHGT